MPQKTTSNRDPRFDVIRCFAMFCVVALHFFLNTGFYDTLTPNPMMYPMTLLRNFFVICVPLFIMLTGSLMNRKTLTPKYYLSVTKTLGIYFLASLACGLARKYLFGEELGLSHILIFMLRFDACDYAWYIEMYLGLFLMIPFLNALYHTLSKKEKQALIFTLIVLTALPGIVNVYPLRYSGWWKMPSQFSHNLPLIPDWWDKLYPITYYYLGCYIREEKPRLKKSQNLLLIALCIVLFGSYNYWRNYGSVFLDGGWNNSQSLFTVILATLVYLYLINLDYSRITSRWACILKNLSDCCLGAYLVSYIFDCLYYPILCSRVPTAAGQFTYFPLLVPAVLFSSLALSYGLNQIYLAGQLCLRKILSNRF